MTRTVIAAFLGFATTLLAGDPSGPVTLDLVAKAPAKSVFDDGEPRDWSQKVSIPKGRPEWAFALSEVEKKKFATLQSKLGEAAFKKLLKHHKYATPKNEFETFRGRDNLPVYYITRPDAKGATILILIAMGEYQPTRWIVNVEGVWRVKGVTLD